MDKKVTMLQRKMLLGLFIFCLISLILIIYWYIPSSITIIIKKTSPQTTSRTSVNLSEINTAKLRVNLSEINTAKLRPRILKHLRGKSTLHAFYKKGKNDNYLNSSNTNDMLLCNNCSTDPSFGILTRKYRNCAVVGNGGILSNSNCGNEIDSMDFVLRFNMAALKGYTDDVGFKTTIMSINMEGFKMLLKNKKLQKSLYSLPENTILWHLKHLSSSRKYLRAMYDILHRPKYQHNGLRLAFTAPDSDIITPTRRLWKMAYPTSGLIGFTFAATICNKISMYGFYPFYQDENNNTLANHYYETTKFNFASDTKHTYNHEYALFKDLNRTGAIRLVTSRCSW
ncbi:alpha-2,8-sialyltransferase 8B-like [Amphiura filiformis]|uniref:alpha-2,8-sialyltransferase 8B-like n=1 Tax=Amphiura filiformis TaxID=82378 RepID=UPI003B21FCAD